LLLFVEDHMTIETEGPAPKRRRTARKRKTAETKMATPLPIEEQPLVPVEDNPANQTDGKPTEVEDNPANEVPGPDKIVVDDNPANEVPDPVTGTEPVDDPYPPPPEPQPEEPITIPEPEEKPECAPEPTTVPLEIPEDHPAAPDLTETEETDAGEKSPAAATVKIRCTSYAKPRTDWKPLRFGEQAEVSRELADILVRNGHAEII
jgi:hypothetical protein